MKRTVGSVFILVFFWLIITSNYSIFNLLIGLLTSLLLIAVNHVFVLTRAEKFIIPETSMYLIYSVLLVSQLLKASIKHTYRILFMKEIPSTTFDITVPTSNKLVITLLCNLITQTPGTITTQVTGSRITVLAMGDLRKEEIEESILKNLYLLTRRRKHD